jgi:hypothetical protein
MNDYLINERLAVVESRLTENDEQNKAILLELKCIRGEINKYKGFIGSVWFVISCLGVFISAFKFFHKG